MCGECAAAVVVDVVLVTAAGWNWREAGMGATVAGEKDQEDRKSRKKKGRKMVLMTVPPQSQRPCCLPGQRQGGQQMALSYPAAAATPVEAARMCMK